MIGILIFFHLRKVIGLGQKKQQICYNISMYNIMYVGRALSLTRAYEKLHGMAKILVRLCSNRMASC
jgi:hypothetical protein